MASSGALSVLRKVTDVLEGYSTDARRVVSLATAEARQLGHSRVGTEHLLLGLLADSESDTAASLRTAGATLAGARFTVSEVVTETVDATGGDEDIPYSPRAQRALERAGRFARRSRDPEVTPDHVLLGVLDVEGLACQVMRGLGVDLGRLRESIAPTQPASEFAVVDPQPEQQELAPPMRPHCPNCYAELDGNLVETVVVARREDDTTTDVRVAFCLACGATLGALRAEQT